jgi:AraC-like DNA-binding protein
MEGLVFGWRTALLLILALQMLGAAAWLVLRRYERRANLYLALLLVVIIGHLTPHLIGFAGFYDRWPILSGAPFSIDLAVGPLLLAYAYSLTRTRPPRALPLLFIPAIAEFVYGLVMMSRPPEAKAWWNETVHLPYVFPLEIFGGLALAGAALILSALRYRAYRRWLAEHSSAASEFDPRWLGGFLAALTLLGAVWLAYSSANVLFGPYAYSAQYPFFLFLGLVFMGLAVGALVSHREPFPKPDGRAEAEAETPARPDRDWASEAVALRDRIREEAWHLEPRLSLDELARRMATNETYLSRAVNQGAGVNFNRFVNEIRVEDVKARLAAGAEDVLAAALESGFNSKATFNRVFRELTGVTPAAYRAGAAAG